MRSWVSKAALIALLLSSAPAWAQQRVDALSAGVAVQGTDLFANCQSCSASVNLVKTTVTQLLTFFNANALIPLATGTSGTLDVGRGGTGLTAGTSGGVLAYTATGTLASSGALTANRIVLGGGAGAAPTPLGSLGTTTTVLHGNAAGPPSYGAVSLTSGTGDVTGTLGVTNGGLGIAAVSADQVPTGTASNVYTAKTIPDCDDTGGNHLNYDTTTHVWSCGTSGGGAGSVTSVGLAPGFTKTIGTQNTGADAITSTGTINSQLWPVLKTSGSPYTVATADSGVLLLAGAASYTFTLPNAASGTKGSTYQFGSDGTYGFTLTTVGGAQSIYGCAGGGGTSLVVPPNTDVLVIDDGTNYKCTTTASPIIAYPLTYAPGVNMASMPVTNIYQARVIVGIRCTPEVVSGGAATLQPVKAASATLISAGTNLTSNTCNVNTAAATDQNLTVSVTTLAAGDRIGLIGSGATITSANAAAQGVITVFIR